VRLPYLGRKLLQLGLTLLAVATFNFLLFRVLPGDPLALYARSGHLTPEAADQLRRVFGLDQPLIQQFGIYLRDLSHGNLGFSLTFRRPVADIVFQRLANTVLLVGAATVFVVVLGVVLGVVAASRRGSRLDSGTVFGSLVLWSMPTFWVGLLLVFAFGVWWKLLPITGIATAGAIYSGPLGAPLDVARHLILPTLTLALVDIGQFVLITRSSLIDVLTEDFVTTAKAKGMPRRQVETVFSWPGMGELTYDAVLRRDYPVLQACFLLFAIAVIVANFASDLVYLWLDPRVREA
jgi:peptide/nickel transport system permease protein